MLREEKILTLVQIDTGCPYMYLSGSRKGMPNLGQKDPKQPLGRS